MNHVATWGVIEIEGDHMCPCSRAHVDHTETVGGIEIVNRVSKGANIERIGLEPVEP